MNDPGCTFMKCSDFKDGVCYYDGPVCKFHELKADPEDIADAIRFQWLIRRGVAWRGCYEGDWKENEWLYEMQGARKEIDAAMAKNP